MVPEEAFRIDSANEFGNFAIHVTPLTPGPSPHSRRQARLAFVNGERGARMNRMQDLCRYQCPKGEVTDRKTLQIGDQFFQCIQDLLRFVYAAELLHELLGQQQRIERHRRIGCRGLSGAF